MSQDLTFEMLSWNADRRPKPFSRTTRFHLAPLGTGMAGAMFEFDRDPVEGVRPYHLMIWDFPPYHFFSRSPALYKAFQRLIDEP